MNHTSIKLGKRGGKGRENKGREKNKVDRKETTGGVSEGEGRVENMYWEPDG